MRREAGAPEQSTMVVGNSSGSGVHKDREMGERDGGRGDGGAEGGNGGGGGGGGGWIKLGQQSKRGRESGGG